MLYQMRYKHPRVGITEGLIELDEKSTLADAEAVGRKLCEEEPGYLFIRVEYAILNKRPKSADDDEFRAVRKAS